MRKRHAFTLIELLVVIGIIAMLISILLPTLGKARQAAYSTMCQSNLRTQGQAISLYAMNNKGLLPPSSAGNAAPVMHIGSILAQQLGVGDGSVASAASADTIRTRGISLCRAGFLAVGVNAKNQNNYSAHPLLLPDKGLNYPANFPGVSNPTNVQRRQYKLASIRSAADITLLFDGVQNISTGNANYDGRMIDNQRISDTANTSPGVTFLLTNPNVDLSQSIDGGPNLDAPNETINATTKVYANVRWRHGRNNIANFLFADGHVDGRSFIDVLNGKTDTLRDVAFAQHTAMGVFGTVGPFPVRTATDGRYQYIRCLTPDKTFSIDGWTKSQVLKSWQADAASDPALGKRVDQLYHPPAEALYDLSADPYELSNVIADPTLAAVKDALSKKLDAWMAQQGDHGLATELDFKVHMRTGRGKEAD